MDEIEHILGCDYYWVGAVDLPNGAYCQVCGVETHPRILAGGERTKTFMIACNCPDTKLKYAICDNCYREVASRRETMALRYAVERLRKEMRENLDRFLYLTIKGV